MIKEFRYGSLELGYSQYVSWLQHRKAYKVVLRYGNYVSVISFSCQTQNIMWKRHRFYRYGSFDLSKLQLPSLPWIRSIHLQTSAFALAPSNNALWVLRLWLCLITVLYEFLASKVEGFLVPCKLSLHMVTQSWKYKVGLQVLIWLSCSVYFAHYLTYRNNVSVGSSYSYKDSSLRGTIGPTSRDSLAHSGRDNRWDLQVAPRCTPT